MERAVRHQAPTCCQSPADPELSIELSSCAPAVYEVTCTVSGLASHAATTYPHAGVCSYRRRADAHSLQQAAGIRWNVDGGAQFGCELAGLAHLSSRSAPPGFAVRAGHTITSWPCRAKSVAADSPPMPAPTTTTLRAWSSAVLIAIGHASVVVYLAESRRVRRWTGETAPCLPL